MFRHHEVEDGEYEEHGGTDDVRNNCRVCDTHGVVLVYRI